MFALRVLLLTSLCLASASADDQRGPPRPPPRPAANCQEDTDCPAYHWCETHYIGLGQWNGSDCESMSTGPGTPCREDNVCQRADMPDEPEYSTAQCFDGTCRKSYYMPCRTRGDCAEGFNCERRSFSSGPAKVCIPSNNYYGGDNMCRSNFDCGYSHYFGDRWMPCRGGVCDRIMV